MPTYTTIAEGTVDTQKVYEELQALVDKSCRGRGYIFPGELKQAMLKLGLMTEESVPFEGREAEDVPF